MNPESALLLLALCAAVPADADVTDRLARTLPLAAGRAIRIEASVADVTIVGSDRTDLAVEIVRRAPTAADLAKYPAVVDADAAPIRIAAVQADEGRDANLRTEVTIGAPADAVFESIRVFEGRVKLTNLKGSCDLDLRRGAIDAAGISGRMRLEAGVGSVDVRQAELTPGGMMRLRLFNGPLRVRLARMPASARILAVTYNGTIKSEIPLAMKDKFGPRFGETTIGNGDPVMSIDVVKGDIAIAVGK
jgi:hypothetical protein